MTDATAIHWPAPGELRPPACSSDALTPQRTFAYRLAMRFWPELVFLPEHRIWGLLGAEGWGRVLRTENLVAGLAANFGDAASAEAMATAAAAQGMTRAERRIANAKLQRQIRKSETARQVRAALPALAELLAWPPSNG